MVAQDEVLIFGYHARRHGTLIAIFGRHVILHQRLPVDDHLPVVYFHAVARHSDYALDVGLGGIAGKPEDHRVAAIDIAEVEPVNKFVDEDAFLIVQRGHHAGALHFHWLVDEQDNEDGQDDRAHQVPGPMSDGAQSR